MFGCLFINSYWLVYELKSKRFLWIAQDKDDHSNIIIGLQNISRSKNGRYIVMLIDGGYKLKFQGDYSPSWKTYLWKD